MDFNIARLIARVIIALLLAAMVGLITHTAGIAWGLAVAMFLHILLVKAE